LSTIACALVGAIVASPPAAAQYGAYGRFGTFGAQTGAQDVREEIERAERYCSNERGRYSDRRSIAGCSELLSYARHNPSFVNGQFRSRIAERNGEAFALMMRGYAYIRAGRGDEALRDIDEALSVYADEPTLLFARCQANMLVDNLDQALADCDASMQVEPSANALVARGAVHLRRSEFDAALADFELAGALPAYAQYGRGLARVGLGQSAEGGADIEAAAAQDEGVAAWFARLGLSVSWEVP
jgi:tetratricopeptide (TPR) repeat protein